MGSVTHEESACLLYKAEWSPVHWLLMQTEVSAARGSQAQEWILLSTPGAQQVSLFIIVILTIFEGIIRY